MDGLSRCLYRKVSMTPHDVSPLLPRVFDNLFSIIIIFSSFFASTLLDKKNSDLEVVNVNVNAFGSTVAAEGIFSK